MTVDVTLLQVRQFQRIFILSLKNDWFNVLKALSQLILDLRQRVLSLHQCYWRLLQQNGSSEDTCDHKTGLLKLWRPEASLLCSPAPLEDVLKAKWLHFRLCCSVRRKQNHGCSWSKAVYFSGLSSLTMTDQFNGANLATSQTWGLNRVISTRRTKDLYW